MTTQNASTREPVTLRPLSRGRYRPDEVEQQIRWLLETPFSEASRRMSEKDATGAPLIKEEALVYLLRHFHRAGRSAETNRIATVLLDRTSPRIARWVQHSLPGGFGVHSEQCVEEIQTQMWTALFNDVEGCEFWEVKFWLCLKRRVSNCVDQARRVLVIEVHPVIDAADSDEPRLLLDLLPDPKSESMHTRVEMQEALNGLAADHRQALHLYLQEQWNQQQIAEYFGVSDRTIRNWLGAALKHLRGYYDVSPDATASGSGDRHV